MSMGEPRRIALVTGASAGIGADLARILAREGHDLALVARSGGRLDALAESIAASGRPRPLVFARDLSDPRDCDALAAEVEASGARVDILVNNAGFGLNGRAVDLDRAEQLRMIDLNVRALTDLCLRFAPHLVAARGRVLNVASVAGFMPGPGMAVYYATKAFVVSFSAALGEELRGSGVSVTCLCPGYTPTEFQTRAGLDPSLAARVPTMSSERVAEEGYRALMARRRRVTTGALNKFAVGALSVTPHALLLPIVARAQSARRRN